MSRKKVEDYEVISVSLYLSDVEKLETIQKSLDLSRSATIRELIKRVHRSVKSRRKGGVK